MGGGGLLCCAMESFGNPQLVCPGSSAWVRQRRPNEGHNHWIPLICIVCCLELLNIITTPEYIFIDALVPNGASTPPPLLVPDRRLALPSTADQTLINLRIDYHLSCVDAAVPCNLMKHLSGTLHMAQGVRNNQLGSPRTYRCDTA